MCILRSPAGSAQAAADVLGGAAVDRAGSRPHPSVPGRVEAGESLRGESIRPTSCNTVSSIYTCPGQSAKACAGHREVRSGHNHPSPVCGWREEGPVPVWV
ncbi:hypothetical protein NDU88_000589 [Pleurodeles waltl]|uniref:Uncharacterized protein n=1 Tax=Pleurodeles waltl TaxID=8319 RepID=A0AAV7LVY9_PLEWA|nr:hypothetical protein NDU88_000589 [Pleurodeles waltl]